MDENHEIVSRSAEELVRVRFPLDERDTALGVEAENLWARPLGGEAFEIDNIPFYIYGISNKDVVSGVRIGSSLQYDHVIARGGHSTYRVLISNEAGYRSPAWTERWTKMAALGCSCEVAKKRWIAIDIPPQVDADRVYSLLDQGANEGVWNLDEGHCGHPLSA